MSTPVALVSQRIQQVLEIDPDQTAVWSGGSSWTWRDIHDVQKHIDRALDSVGAPQTGARVALVMKTTFASVACQSALLARGHTIFSLSPMMGDERLQRDIAGSGAYLVIGDSVDWAREGMQRGCVDLGAPGLVAWPSDEEPMSEQVPGGIHNVPALRSPDVANVMLTSGTTGDPKRISIGYDALDNMLAAVRHYSASTRNAQDGPRLSKHHAVIASPLVHSSGFGGVVRALAEARPLVLLERFSVDGWTDAVDTFRPSTVALPPPALAMILDADVPLERLSSLRAIIVGSAALSADLEEAFESHYGIPLLCTYGATEFPGGLAGWTLKDKQTRSIDKRTSVGRVHPGVELRVNSPESGHPVPPGTRGLLDVRTPVTDRNQRNGWVQTKDIASIDADGYVYIHGRADDAIIRGGFKVLPQEVEAALEAHPAVGAVGVVGRPDPRLGEVPVAIVELRANVEPDELILHARSNLASYQVPVAIHVMRELPRTPSMKISKPMLRDWLAQHDTSEATGQEARNAAHS